MTRLAVTFLDRTWTEVSVPLPHVQVKTMSKSFRGGSDKAQLRVFADPSTLTWLGELMRYGIQITDETGTPVWFGFVSAILLHGATATTGLTFEGMANSIDVAYVATGKNNSSGDRATTAAATSAESIADFGTKQYRHSATNLDATAAATLRDVLVANMAYPQETFDLAGDEAPGATIECQGLWHSLTWQLYSNPSGLEQHTTGNNVHNLGEGSGITRLAQRFYLATGVASFSADTIAIRGQGLGSPADSLTVEVRSETYVQVGTIWADSDCNSGLDADASDTHVSISANRNEIIRVGDVIRVYNGLAQYEDMLITAADYNHCGQKGFTVTRGYASSTVRAFARGDVIKMLLPDMSGAALSTSTSVTTPGTSVADVVATMPAFTVGDTTPLWLVITRSLAPNGPGGKTWTSGGFYSFQVDTAKGYPRGECWAYIDNLGETGWRRAVGGDACLVFTVSGKVAITTQLSAIVTASGQFLASTLLEDSSTVSTVPYQNGDRTAQDVIADLLDLGTGSLAFECEVTPQRVLRIWAEPASTDTPHGLSGHVVTDPYGVTITPAQVKPGVWLQVLNTAMLTRQGIPAGLIFLEGTVYESDKDEVTLMLRNQRDYTKVQL